MKTSKEVLLARAIRQYERGYCGPPGLGSISEYGTRLGPKVYMYTATENETAALDSVGGWGRISAAHPLSNWAILEQWRQGRCVDSGRPYTSSFNSFSFLLSLRPNSLLSCRTLLQEQPEYLDIRSCRTVWLDHPFSHRQPTSNRHSAFLIWLKPSVHLLLN